VTFSSIGLPLLNGFVGEFMILLGAFQYAPWPTVVAATGVIFGAAHEQVIGRRAGDDLGLGRDRDPDGHVRAQGCAQQPNAIPAAQEFQVSVAIQIGQGHPVRHLSCGGSPGLAGGLKPSGPEVSKRRVRGPPLRIELSVAAHLGAFGPLAQAFSAVIALVTALIAAPLIAWATGSRYYLARVAPLPEPAPAPVRQCAAGGAFAGQARAPDVTQTCVICERDYEGPDMAHCPAYLGSICSLCCTLDARCGDLCKPHATLGAQWAAALSHMPARLPSIWSINGMQA
jgi:hypothetical protein